MFSSPEKKTIDKMRTSSSSSKKIKYKNLQLKAVATDYLANISLDGNSDTDLKKAYFENIISNEFDCFLNFNKISPERGKQTEYFKYYKNKLAAENSNLKSARLDSFLQTEFSGQSDGQNVDTKLYIDEIVSRKKKSDILAKNKPTSLTNSRNPTAAVAKQMPPAVNIIPAISFENEHNKSTVLKTSISDVEADYIQTCLVSDVSTDGYAIFFWFNYN